MYTFLIVLHVLVALLLIVVILMQSSKGGGLAGAFGGAGGGGSQALFGGRGAANFLQKVTVGLAITFMVLALIINLMGPGGEGQRSVVREAAQQQELTPGTSLPKPGGMEGSGALSPGTEQIPLSGQETQENQPAQGDNQTE